MPTNRREFLKKSSVIAEVTIMPKYLSAMASKHYKYTVMSEKNAVGKPWQFFDLKKDPYEINNLINSPQMKGEIKKHHEYLQAAMIKSEDTFPIE